MLCLVLQSIKLVVHLSNGTLCFSQEAMGNDVFVSVLLVINIFGVLYVFLVRCPICIIAVLIMGC